MIRAFEEIFEDQTKLGTKVQTNEYRESGSRIIVDQGQEQIAGYTDREEGIFTAVPAIVFGDHTRIVKYVDEPFFLGADGVKVLRSRMPDANYRYLYYALRHAKIPNTGYNRHFKWLKELKIEYPDATRQTEVVTILDMVGDLIAAHQRQLRTLDTLIKTRFVEMFGDPVSNPKNWPVRPLLDMGDCKNGMNFHYDDAGVDLHCLGVGDFQDHSIIADTSSLSIVSLNELPSDEYMLQDDDIVFVRSNGNKALVGRCVAVYPGDVPTTFSGFCIRYRKRNEEITVPYLLRVLKTDSMRAKMAGRGANIQNLNQQIIGTLIIPVPPLTLQEQFSAFVSQVDKSKVLVQKALEKVQLMFDSLMQKYFG